MIKSSITGLDSLTRNLERMATAAKELDGEHSIPATELLHPEFMRCHSRFGTLQDLFDASSFKIETQEDFEAVPEAEWDQYIRTSTDFPDWKSMLEEAAREWAMKRMGLL